MTERISEQSGVKYNKTKQKWYNGCYNVGYN